ncbi:hypothetical protein C9J12_02930 [Photobacterium frigidiphilum]|uniref:Glycosyltransferase n=1 Tax=Photobacterium frigidiphilum TaxID=264736 RepID=A0A2T3JPF9_9GAMM|nr:glycosyltransferase [Photobacterium frigidiphilum]PSU50937.1 hypothetical protein C9J12_02930 [Photobacterium frigidiphilum]
MNVFIIIPTLRAGGAESVVVSLANSISSSESDINCTVVTIFDDVGTDYFAGSLSKDVNVIQLGLSLKSKFKAVYSLYKVIKQLKPDVIHTHLTGIFYSSLSSWFLDIRLIHTVHTQPSIEFSGLKKSLFKLVNTLIQPCIVSLNEKSENEMKNNFSCFSTIIPNGSRNLGSVDRVANRNFVIVARFDPVKRHEVLIKSFIDASRNTDSNLYIVGVCVSGHEKYYQDLKNKIDLSERIHLFENVSSNNELSQLFSKSQFVVLSSLYEGLPVSLLEGMSTGLIPVGLPTPGLLDFFQINGLTRMSRGDDVCLFSNNLKDCIFLSQSDVDTESDLSKKIFDSTYSSSIMASRYSYLYNEITKV